MISKELLELVLKTDSGLQKTVTAITTIDDNNLHYKFKWSNKHLQKGLPYNSAVNLDTLGRLCKEWCNYNLYMIWSGTDSISPYCEVLNSKYETKLKSTHARHFDGTTELEAIIKATEWVAKGKGLIDE